MKFNELYLKDSYVIEPEPFEDNRGKFSRVFCKDEFQPFFSKEFVQINHSITYKKGSVRGFHFQYPPYTEVKMVKCIKGAILDIIIDIREGSETFLQHHSEVLSADNMKMLYIPEGFAHGFQTLENNSELLYFHSEFYTPNYEGALNIKDEKLNIEFPLDIVEISEKDQNHPFIDDNFKGVKI